MSSCGQQRLRLDALERDGQFVQQLAAELLVRRVVGLRQTIDVGGRQLTGELHKVIVEGAGRREHQRQHLTAKVLQLGAVAVAEDAGGRAGDQRRGPAVNDADVGA